MLILLPSLLKGQSGYEQDTLKAEQLPAVKVDSVNQLQDSLEIQRQVDSLQKFTSSLDTLLLWKNLDSLRQLPQSAYLMQATDSTQGLLDEAATANQQQAKLQQQLNQPVQGSQQQLQQEIDRRSQPEGLNQEAMAELKQQSGIAINTSLPEVHGIDIQGHEISRMELPEIELPGTGIPETGLSIPDLPGVSGLESIKGLQDDLGDVSDLANELDGQSGELGKLSEGKNVDKLAEQQFRQSEAGQAFQNQSGLSQAGLSEVQGMTGKDYLKEHGKAKVYNAAVDHFAEQKEKLNASRAKLAQYKGRYGKVENIQDVPQGILKHNPLKDKPWQERVLLGSLWQFGRQEQYLIDLGPTLAWRITDWVSAGGGFQYRLSISTAQKPWVNSSDRVIGYFIFSDFQIRKGFFARLCFDDLQTEVPRFNLLKQPESYEKAWIKGLSIGLGKNYTFYKQLKGYALMQYNVLHRSHQSAYAQPVQAKIGFYINGKHLLRIKEDKIAE